MNIIESVNISKNYGRVKALDNISFTIEENKITGLIGRNGAGKSTILKIIAGFIKETSGNINVFGENPFNSILVSANMIFIDDQMTLPASLNLSETLEAASKFYKNWDHQLATKLFDYFSFDGTRHHYQLSKGMRSTFNMILGVASRCPLSIFDEPTTGMDAAVRKDFYRVLLKDYLAFPRTIILSSHYLEEIEDLLEDIFIINNGRNLLHTSITDFKEMAIELKGKTQAIEKFTQSKEIYHSRTIDSDTSYVVVNNDFAPFLIEKMQLEGIDISVVAPTDLFVYLTNDTKGGVDHVFN
ncbi:ABC transporter ATP-binding protein [Bacillus sp. FJAT-49736]|uniref:ABC transporter ATP-binding protein n=1 Tax=Bacillus sp. FJAT-49736 TaxID=2833582 RepID=UPI001BC9961F|nr:ABC transporter ATP-binding protein [Bacillus sp. FJAT-49736]MBS4174413.1 ABC transporter ATP-binding protein [Bacillus sp. FJAT-49736]